MSESAPGGPSLQCSGASAVKRIVLQKSFEGDRQNFLGLLRRFVRRDVSDYIAYQKIDHELRIGAIERRSQGVA
jgi:hypothetical protein